MSLHLNSAPDILFLFGLSGSGKSFIGDFIGKKTGRYVYHADDDITDEMKLALKDNRPFTNTMRDRYFPIIVDRILSLHQRYGALIVTQAVYKQRHRDYLLANVPNMEMLFINAPDQFILKNLANRHKGISHTSAVALRNDFEHPAKNIKEIKNNESITVITEQLNQLFP